MMKWWIGGAAALLLIVIGSWFIVNRSDDKMVSPVVKERPLNKYTIENLGKRGYKSEIILDDAIATTSAYTVYKFYFDSDGKKVTGLAHIPAGRQVSQKFPVIVQFRGYVERDIY